MEIFKKTLIGLLIVMLALPPQARAETAPLCVSLFSTTQETKLEVEFNKYKLLNPFYALKLAWENRDKRFFTFIENPAIGVPAFLPGVGIARVISGEEVIDLDFISDFGAIYGGNQIASMFRSGVSLEKRISDRYALFLLWYYTTISYAATTAVPAFATAQTKQDVIYATSLAVYSALWPLLSQTLNRKLFTPLLFTNFPRKSVMDSINGPAPTAQLIEVQMFRKEQAEIELKTLKDALRGEYTSLSEYREVMGRILNELDSNGQAYKTLVDLMGEDSVTSGKEKSVLRIKELESEIKNADASIKWIEFFRKNLSPGQKIPLKRKVAYWGVKTAVMTSVATFTAVGYFLLRSIAIGTGTDADPGLLYEMTENIFNTYGPDVPLDSNAVAKSVEQTQEMMANFIP